MIEREVSGASAYSMWLFFSLAPRPGLRAHHTAPCVPRFLEETKEDLGTSNTELSAVLESAGWNVDGSSRRC